MLDSWRRCADEALVTLTGDRWETLTGYAYLLAGNRQEAPALARPDAPARHARGA